MMVDTPKLTRERLDSLAEQIANLSLRIDIAKHTLLTHLREFDIHDGWAGSGFISLAAWLSWRIGIGLTAARDYVRVARALGELPLIDAAFAAGNLTYSKVRALTRAAKPETEQGLIDIAMHATAAQVETICAAYRRTRVDPSEPPADLRRFMRRATTPSGMVRIELQLPPEMANVIWAAMNAALDAGRSEVDSAEAPSETGIPKAEADSAEAPGDSGTRAANDASAEARLLDSTVTLAERADAMVSVAQSFLDHPHRTLGSGYELVMMTSPDQAVESRLALPLPSHARARGPAPSRIARRQARVPQCPRPDAEARPRARRRGNRGSHAMAEHDRAGARWRQLPKWDGSRLDLDAVLGWMFAAEA